MIHPPHPPNVLGLQASLFSVYETENIDKTSNSRVQVVCPLQPLDQLGPQTYAMMLSYFFKFFIEMRSCYVAQAGLKLLASRDSPS
ncbi:hypothetical protein AAY473_011600 [Plecturocebus cupreus]